MAAVSLNSNLSALRAARSLQSVTTELSSLYEHLSSGTRINHASDDPAGLAEASKLRAAGRVYTQATRNVNDSISFFNVADSATSALKNVLGRMSELATQASNGVLSDPQRQTLDQESQALQLEYGRILETAKYNSMNVYTTGEIATQAGFGVEAVILADISSGSSTTRTTSTTKGDGTFQVRQAFGTGGGPASVAVGDFNSDGVKDLVTADAWNNTASVLLGNGNGTFQAKQSFGAGTMPMSVAVADFNGDGISDMVTTDYGAGFGYTASVLLGNGNGTFKAKRAFGTGWGPMSVAVADFNGDGRSDLAISDAFGDTASVLLGNGNGTFQVRQSLDTGLVPFSVAVADFNSDGVKDLVTADSGGASVLLGNGDGTFQARQPFGTGSVPISVAVGDFNSDGRSDMVTADNNANTASVLLGNGNGTFQARQAFGTGTMPESVAVADFNSDGKSDLVTADLSSETATVLLGNGNGTFQARQAFGTGSGPGSVAVADFNGDGWSDLVTADSSGNTASVLLGNATTQTTTVTTNCLQPITGVSLATQDDALAAQGQIQGYQNGLSVVSGAIGAVLSRFQIAVQLTTSTADAYMDAEARITNIDVATDVATLVRKQIIQQAATAMLAQANQQSALVLTLLH